MQLEIRPAVGYTDLQRWVETCNATSNDTMTTQGRALVRAREIDSVDLLAVEDGKPVGVALLAGDPRSLALRQPWCDVRVLELHRCRGVGSALLANLIACARSAGHVGLRCSAGAEDADSLAFLSRRGFTVTRSIEEVSLELERSSPVDLQLPEGIELLRLADEPALVPAMYALASATAADRADRIGGVVPTETDWRAYELSSPLVRLDMTTVAIADGAAVGYSVLQDVPGHHGLLHYTLVVAPVWREQGLAHTLVRKAMRDAVAEGVPRLTARPENQFEADLFASLGYRVRERRVEYGLTL